jgi:allantoinase
VDVGVVDGRIAAVGDDLGDGAEVLDATGLHVLPGGIDPHVHFDEPGRTDWEGVASGTRALAAGGFTTYVDMPLNNVPVTVDGPSFDVKLAAVSASSLVDFGLWGGLVPGNLDRLRELHERGVCGFKAFMCHSGIDEFPGVDDRTLADGMQRIAELGSVLLLHAESASIVASLGAQFRQEGRVGPRDFAASRPPAAEIEAIAQAVLLAEETGCATHIVHVSTAGGVALVAEAAARGVDVTCETCPHYLLFTEDDLDEVGLPLKSAPPVRTAADRDGLWALIAGGELAMVTSDHSPGAPEVKVGDFFTAWGGISGCQSTLQLVLEAGHVLRGLPLERVAALTATTAAGRFGLPGKGRLEPGFDADLALVDLRWTGTVELDDLHYRHPYTAYEGQAIRGRVVRTLLRGRTVYADGDFDSEPRGRLLTPRRNG